jgi:hypothetical protein
LCHPGIDLSVRDKSGLTPFATALTYRNNKAAQAILDKLPTAAEQVSQICSIRVLNEGSPSLLQTHANTCMHVCVHTHAEAQFLYYIHDGLTNTVVVFDGVVIMVFAIGPKVCRFKPNQEQWISRAIKILAMTSFREEVKPSEC